jgi:glyoxylase-like metal-dependent hydrolase (beta-lactamase superfamily II)
MNKTLWAVLAAAITAMILNQACLAQGQDFSTVEIKVHPVQGKINYLEGSGGNIGVLAGDDGVVMIDNQFAPLSDKIVAAIRTLSGAPIELIVNTHIHGDHNGGNENFSEMGVSIVAHDNVRARIVQSDPPRPDSARPVITYTDRVSFYLNGETINVIKVPAAHTDGDSIVHFVESNVIHAGDVFRTTGYPGVDASNGGSVNGTVSALDVIVRLSDFNTKIVPGHGVVATREDVIEFRDMVIEVRERILDLLDQNMTVEQIVAAAPTADLDERWGSFERFLPGFVQALAAER